MFREKILTSLVYGISTIFTIILVAMIIPGITFLSFFIISPFVSANNIDKNELINAKCLSCHGKTDFNINRQGKKVNLYVDQTKYKQSIHGTNACTSCHSTLVNNHPKILKNNLQAQQISKSCQDCHDKVSKVYQTSIHGQLALKGQDTALCQDCHGTHNIQKKEVASAMTYWRNLPQTCTKCHSTNIHNSYNYSFHGTSIKLGYQKAATCYDCHGSHEILQTNDPQSKVSQKNRPQTCANCHAKAEPNFAKGKEHVVPQDKSFFSLNLLWKIFVVMILFDASMGSSIAIFELFRKLIKSRNNH